MYKFIYGQPRFCREPPVLSSVWDGIAVVTNVSLAPASVYSFSSGLPPCSLHVSLSMSNRFFVRFINEDPLSSSTGDTSLRLGHVDDNSSRRWLLQCFQKPCFSCCLHQPVVDHTVLQAFSNSGSAMPLLLVSLEGVQNCSLVSFTLPSVVNPILPQSSRKNIGFQCLDQIKTFFSAGIPDH